MIMIRFARSEGTNAGSADTDRMAAVGDLPARDLEFEALLRDAAEFQRMDIGCKLRGEAIS
ncbi:MAG TPA: hypothetical protein VFB23_09535 [Candidatus Acidoferrales bacterium]|jgi:hypothetical protein|nr:hypothetical protein [Candidatus Acidoferrales bacterium]